MNQWWNGIWNESYMNCGYEIKWSYDLRSYERNFCNCIYDSFQDYTIWTSLITLSLSFPCRLGVFLLRADKSNKADMKSSEAMIFAVMNAIFAIIYDSFHIPFHHWFIPHGTIRTHKWPAPNVSGFIAQLVRASHRNREVTGLNAVEILNSSGFSTQLQKLRS